jgi:predicted dienelactone hydrolase
MTPNVGFRIHTFHSGLRAALWYPATKGDSSFQYANGVMSAIARDAEISSCDRYPLVVFSHGYEACSTQSLFLTEALARAGYLVVAPDHKDALCKVDQPREGRMARAEEPFREPGQWDQNTYVDRRNDIRNVISEILLDEQLSAHIDPTRIGAAGHSLGGYTVAGMAGAWSSWKDPRIRAVLLLSPYVAPFLEHGTLGQIKVPVMYQGGTRDFGITPSVQRRGNGAYDSTSSPKFFLNIRAIGHMGWTNLICRQYGSAQACETESPAAKTITDYGIAFFNQFLKGMKQELLTRGSPQLAEYRSSL